MSSLFLIFTVTSSTWEWPIKYFYHKFTQVGINRALTNRSLIFNIDLVVLAVVGSFQNIDERKEIEWALT